MYKQPSVYLLSNRKDGVLYTGVTSNLIKRIWQHKNKVVKGFSSKYNLHLLIWFELSESMDSAILREKQIKNWKREWKIQLVEKYNPLWGDLYSQII